MSDSAEPTLSKSVQTIIITIVASSILFAASYIYNDAQAKATQVAQLNLVVQQLLELRNDVKVIQQTQAGKDDLKELENRVRALEKAK